MDEEDSVDEESYTEEIKNQPEESQESMSEDVKSKDIFVRYLEINGLLYKVIYLQRKFNLCKTVMLLVSSKDDVGNLKNLTMTALS